MTAATSQEILLHEYQAEIGRLREAYEQAQLSLVRIHTWAGRALAATPDVDLGEQGKAIIEDIYAEADERVTLK